MKTIIALLGALLPCFLTAQITQPGVVLLQNSGKTPLEDVQVTAPGAADALSLGDGRFSLTFASKSKGDYARVTVEKPGYQVVNGRSLAHADLDPEQVLTVIMCPAGEIDRRLTALNERYEKTIKADYEEQLARLKAGNLATPDTLAALEAQYERKLSRLGEFNDDLVQNNLDEASGLRRQALGLYEQGLLDSAINTLQEARIAAEYSGEDAKEPSAVYQTIGAWMDKANLYALKGDLANAKACFHKAIAVDTTNGDPYMRFAYFLNAERQYSEVEPVYLKALQLTTDQGVRGIIQLNLGAFYKNRGRFEAAEQAFRGALGEYRALSRNNPETFRYLEAEALINLGELYYNYDKMEASEAAFAEALPIYREMVASKNDAYRPRLAYSLYYLAIIREDLQKTSEAESEYLESQSIYAALAAEDPESFLLNHANLSYLIGEFYLHNGKPAEAEAAYQLAVSEYRILKAEDDSGFEYYQAESFSALGGIYTEQKRFPEAKTAYSQALIAYSEAETQAPGQYQSHMAATLFNLGSNSSSQGQIQGAISAYSESAAMYRKLSSQQPDVYLDDLADALYNLGFNYSAAGKKQEAEQFYREAYDIFRPLAAQNPVFQAKLANNAFNLGLIYLDADKPEAAEETFLTALDIYRQLAVIKPEVYQAEAASALAQLGLVYSAEKKPEAAEKAMLEAFRIYGDLAKDGSALYRAKTAQTASDIGIFYYRQRKTNAAMESFLIELDLWRGLVREYPAGGYEGRLALALNNLGVQYELQKNFPVALNFYEESIKLREKALLQGKTDEQEEWERVYINILQVRDTALAEDDMPIAVAATRIAAESSDHLKDRSPEMKQDATINYNNLAWLALFTGEYDLAERSARRCLEIDPDFYHANARLGYALLLQGKEKPARKAFGELKGRTDMKGRPYRDVLLAQFDVIESNATSSPPGGWDDIRKWVGKW